MHLAVVAPSGWLDAERLERGCTLLRRLGFTVSIGAHVLDRHDNGYLAGADVDRAADLQAAWCDPGVDAVLCARGGYGAVRLLDLLDWRAMRAAVGDGPAKPFVGSSDVTALHQAFAHHLGVSTLYGPTVAGPILGLPNPDPATVNGLLAALLKPGLTVTGGRPLVPALPHPDQVKGVTVGGTLAMVCALLGTPEAGHADGAIVLLEDVGEAPYRIDRMLTQLLRSGWLDGVAGIACGSWHGCGDPTRIEAVLRERLGVLAVPVLVDLPFGHGKVQATVPLGASAVLDSDAGSLTFGI
jgi:muramoyltetrapeptide carboxypeptidase